MRIGLRAMFATMLLSAGFALALGQAHLSPSLQAQGAPIAPAQPLFQAEEKKVEADTPKDMAKEVERIVERITKRPDRLWVYTYEIRTLAGEENEQRQALANLAAKLLEHENENVQLAGAQLVLSLGGDAEDEAHDVLLELIEKSESDATLTAAARLVARFSPAEPEKLMDAVREALERTKLSAQARVALAEADAILSGEDLAYDRLKGFLTAADHELVARASLALASLGRMDDVRGRLASLAKESGELAIAARLMLETGGMRREIQNLRAGVNVKKTKPKLVEETVRTVYENYVGKTFDHVQDTIDLTPQNLVDNAGRAMALSLDQFCQYLTAEEIRKLSEDNSGSFQGVGAYVVKSEDDPCVKVSQPIYSGPAYRAGLRSGDFIWEAQVGDGERQNLVGLEVEDVVKILRGPAGTKVKIWVKRPGVADLVPLELERAAVKSDTALEAVMPGDIGYVKLTRFGTESHKDMEASLKVLLEKKIKGLVLDLRGNPGGDLRAVLGIADLFLPKGALITRIQGVWGLYAQPVIYASENDPLVGDLPMVVLIDDESASGSELLSGTLKDHGRAVVIGEKTFGKGIGQGFFPMTEKEGAKGAMDREAAKPDGRVLKCTVFNYYILPSGLSIDRKDGVGGVSPHIEVYNPLLSSWEYYELVRLRKSEMIDQWVRETWSQHKDTYMRLADFDKYSEKEYPGFDKLYEKLKTPLSRLRVREELRVVVRTLAADERAEPYHQNYENDFQLQRGLIELAKPMKLDLAAIENYSPFLKDHAR